MNLLITGVSLKRFYRAMRMHSVDYPVARCQSVCRLSVTLSVRHTPVLSVNGYTYPQNFFTIGYPQHSSFSTPNGMQHSDGDPY